MTLPGGLTPPLPGGLVLDDGGWSAAIDGHDLGLTAVEFQLLKVLAGQPGRIFSREQLMDAMYRDERIVADRTVDSHVKKLRKKIGDVLPDVEGAFLRLAGSMIHDLYGLRHMAGPPTRVLNTEIWNDGWGISTLLECAGGARCAATWVELRDVRDFKETLEVCRDDRRVLLGLVESPDPQ